jgi:hypothetical protein
MRSLIYTIAFDCPGSETYQTMARLLALSLRGSGYEEEILVLTNRSSGVFRHGRYGVREIIVETGGLEPAAIGVAAKEHKFRMAPWIDTSEYDQIFYIDCDCLALSNPADRLSSEKEISCAAESWGRITDNPFNSYLTDQEMSTLQLPPINSGVLRIKATSFARLMGKWEDIYTSPRLRQGGFVDQPSWVRLVLDEGEAVEHWKPGQLIRYPLAEAMHVNAYKHAVILHYCGLHGQERLDHMISDYIRLYQPDCLASLARMLDS